MQCSDLEPSLQACGRQNNECEYSYNLVLYADCAGEKRIAAWHRNHAAILPLCFSLETKSRCASDHWLGPGFCKRKNAALEAGPFVVPSVVGKHALGIKVHFSVVPINDGVVFVMPTPLP
jgi:hypothetical protein